MFELFVRLQHDCPYNNLSMKYPDARISHWCSNGMDILEIEANNFASFEGLQKQLGTDAETSKKSKIISKAFHQGKFQLVARTCICDQAVTSASPAIESNNFMEVPPTVLFGGWEHYRLVGFDDADLKGLMKDLDKVGKTEILHKKSMSEGVTNDTFLLSLNSLFGQLTEKQIKALLTAVESGYYEIPKRVTADEIAKRNGQPRSTFEEHIRKAENKIVLAMAPYMMMYAKAPMSPFISMSKTKAAGATVGARVMKQLVEVAMKNRALKEPN